MKVLAMNYKNSVENTLAIILAGGSGSRLHALTNWDAKPAIPFGGKFRIIDFSLSNCVNSGIRKINILTQYKSHSLNKHIQRAWNIFRPELGEFVELIPAQQRLQCEWYQGTADAIYQNTDIIEELAPEYVLVLAGDHIYKMDYSAMINQHIQQDMDMTVGCVEMPVSDASEFGVMSIDDRNRITAFREKPVQPDPTPHNQNLALVSMGIYVFKADFLYRQLRVDAARTVSSHDFGKDIIPALVGKCKLGAFPFRDRETGKPSYWRDVGTIDAFYETNMELCAVTPALNLYDPTWPIWTCQEQLPPAKFVFNNSNRRGMAVDSLISGGCIVSGSKVVSSLLFNNVKVHSYSTIENSVVLNNAEVGRHCKIRNAVIDSDCKIPPNSIIGYDMEEDAHRFHISPKGVVLVSREMLDKRVLKVA